MLKLSAVIQAQTDSYPESSEIRELEVVLLDDKKRTGRPLKLTEARFRRLLGLIREGHTNSAACRIEGLHYTTWRDHIQQKPEWRALVAEAEKVRDEVWRDHALEMIKSAMPKNWQAAMTYLERKYPNAWALRNFVRPDPSAPTAEEELPAEVLSRHHALMLQLAREDEAKRAASQVPELPGPQAA
jgi:hypothetical protein